MPNVSDLYALHRFVISVSDSCKESMRAIVIPVYN